VTSFSLEEVFFFCISAPSGAKKEILQGLLESRGPHARSHHAGGLGRVFHSGAPCTAPRAVPRRLRRLQLERLPPGGGSPFLCRCLHGRGPPSAGAPLRGPSGLHGKNGYGPFRSFLQIILLVSKMVWRPRIIGTCSSGRIVQLRIERNSSSRSEGPKGRNREERCSSGLNDPARPAAVRPVPIRVPVRPLGP
jgi:hypothetical protein